MRSRDSPISRQLRHEKNDRVVQLSILGLFPSLDYSRTNVHANTKIAMQTRLKVLFKAAEDGFVTKYELTKENAEPRLGGGTAEKSLRDLEKMQLLSVTQNVGVTGSKRNDYSLTAKGLIVCLVFKKYQMSQDFSLLVKRLSFVENDLAFTLLLYNRFPPMIRDSLSELGTKGVNFESLTEENIILEIRKEADLLALQSNNNPVQFIAELLMDAPEAILIKLSRDFIEMSKDLKEISKDAPEEHTLTRKMFSDFLASFFSWITSPELRLWLTSKQDITELHSLLDRMKSVVIKDEEELPRLFDTIRTEMRKQLRQRIDVNDFL